MTPIDEAALRAAIKPITEVTGWATVELDRAERELGRGATRAADLARDAQLGASCRLLTRSDGTRILLLEPDTEGRLAASLARFGEGALVTYLFGGRAAADRARLEGFTLSSETEGPFGSQRLVVGGPAWGPHLVVVVAESPPPATIRP